jgi:hypothetical protein
MARNTVAAIPASALDVSLNMPVPDIYYIINDETLPQPCFMLRFSNSSNIPIFLSYDGITLHDAVGPEMSIDIYAQSSARPAGNVAQFPVGLKVYAMRQVGGTGGIYFSAYYQKNG